LIYERVDPHDIRGAGRLCFGAFALQSRTLTARAAGFGLAFHDQLHRCALRRLTPVRIRSMRQALMCVWRATTAGVMPWRAIIVQICSAYSEGTLGLVLI